MTIIEEYVWVIPDAIRFFHDWAGYECLDPSQLPPTWEGDPLHLVEDANAHGYWAYIAICE